MFRKITSAAALLLASIALTPVDAANFMVKDGNLVSQSIRVVTNGDGSFSYVHAAQDSVGTIIDPATKQLQLSILTALGSPLQAGGTVVVGSSALPVGAATAAAQANVQSAPGTSAATAMTIQGSASGVAVPVTVGALPLPALAATAALQTAGNTTLTAIAGAAAPSVFANSATGAASLLASSATYTGASRDSGVVAGAASGISYFNAFFLADQTATARIECSNDATTWYVCVASTTLVASSPLILSVPFMTRYHRAVVVNGPTAETYLWVNTSYTGA